MFGESILSFEDYWAVWAAAAHDDVRLVSRDGVHGFLGILDLVRQPLRKLDGGIHVGVFFC